MTKKQRLGELLVLHGLVGQEQIEEALRLQVGGNRRLGYLLIKMGVLSDDQLLETLSEQLDMPIVSTVDAFDPAVKRVLPRYLCRKYNAIPLRFGDLNLLQMGMLDPLDTEAIVDIENYTGRVVEPVLVRQNDISAAIGRNLPLSAKDIFNPQVYNRFAKVATLCAAVLLLVVAGLLFRYVQTEKYGTISVVENTKLYKNHDLIIGIEGDGKASIFGHGAYATGYYSVTFANAEVLANFVSQKKRNFSQKQYAWLDWVFSQQQPSVQ